MKLWYKYAPEVKSAGTLGQSETLCSVGHLQQNACLAVLDVVMDGFFCFFGIMGFETLINGTVFLVELGNTPLIIFAFQENTCRKVYTIMKKKPIIKDEIANLPENYLTIISIILSIVAIFFSIYSHIENVNLQKKYDRLNTYGMNLSYLIEISDDLEKNDVVLSNNQIKISKEKHISIIPKIGGVQKIYMIYYNQGNVVALLPIEIFTKEILVFLDAQSGMYQIGGYNLDIMGEDDDNYYSTVFFIVEDYNRNIHSNMLIYKVNKKDISDIEINIYSEMDLLHSFNEGNKNISKFESIQMDSYLSLLQKINQIPGISK